MKWHFECPDCGFDDKQLGRLAVDNQRYCGTCSQNGKNRRVVRWLEGAERPEIKPASPGFDRYV